MAINFPNTPSNGDQHTASGITWTYDGTTWKADGISSSYTLPTASSTVLGGIKVGNRLTINSGVLEADVQGGSYGNGDVDTHLNQSNPTSGYVLSWNGSDYAWVAQSGGGTQTRTTANATTASIADGTAADLTIAAAKTYVLHEIQTDKAAWVTLYTDTASRTADANRTEIEDPIAGSGVIAEVVTTQAVSQKITPGTIGFNLDSTPSTNVYLKVVNKSGSTGTVQVTLKYLALEV